MAAKLTGEGSVKYTGSGRLYINSWQTDGNDYKGDTTVDGKSPDEKLTVDLYRQTSFGQSKNITIKEADVNLRGEGSIGSTDELAVTLDGYGSFNDGRETAANRNLTTKSLSLLNGNNQILFADDSATLSVAETLTFSGDNNIIARGLLTTDNKGNENVEKIDGTINSITAQSYTFKDMDLATLELNVANQALNYSDDRGSVSFENVDSSEQASTLNYSFANNQNAALTSVRLSNSKIKYADNVSITTEQTDLAFSELTVNAEKYSQQLGKTVNFFGNSNVDAFNNLIFEDTSDISLTNISFNSSDNNENDRISFRNSDTNRHNLNISSSVNFTNYDGWTILNGYSLDLTNKVGSNITAVHLFGDVNSLRGGLGLAANSVVSVSGTDTVYLNRLGWSGNATSGNYGILDLTGFNFDKVSDSTAAVYVDKYLTLGSGAVIKIDSSDFTLDDSSLTPTDNVSIFDLTRDNSQLLVELNSNVQATGLPTLLDENNNNITEHQKDEVLYTSYINPNNTAAIGTFGWDISYDEQKDGKNGLCLGYGLNALELVNGHADKSYTVGDELNLESAFVAQASATTNNYLDIGISGYGILVFKNHPDMESSMINVTTTKEYSGLTLVSENITLNAQNASALGSDASLVLAGNNANLVLAADTSDVSDSVKMSVAGLVTDSEDHSITLNNKNTLVITGNIKYLDESLATAINDEFSTNLDINSGNIITSTTSVTGTGSLQIGVENEANDVALNISSVDSLNDFTGNINLADASSILTVGKSENESPSVLDAGSYSGNGTFNLNSGSEIAKNKADFSNFTGTLNLGDGSESTITELSALNSSAKLNLNNASVTLNLNDSSHEDWENVLSGTGNLNFKGTTDVSMTSSQLDDFSGDLNLDGTSKVRIDGLANINSTISADLESETLLSLSSTTGNVDWSGLTGSGTVELINTADEKTDLIFSNVNTGFKGTAHLSNYAFEFGDETNTNSQLVSQAAIVAENTDLTVKSAIKSQGIALVGDSSLKFESDNSEIAVGGNISSLITIADGKKFTISGSNTIAIDTDTINIVTDAIANAQSPEVSDDVVGILGTVDYLQSSTDNRYITLVEGEVENNGSLTLVDEAGNVITGDTGIAVKVQENDKIVADIGYGTAIKTGSDNHDLFIGEGATDVTLHSSVTLNAEKEIEDDFNLNVSVTSDSNVDVVIAGNKALTLSGSDNSFTGDVTVNKEAILNLASANALGGNNGTQKTSALIVNGTVNAKADQSSQKLELNAGGNLNLEDHSLSLTKENDSSSISGKLTGSEGSSLVLAQNVTLIVSDNADISEMAGTYDLTQDSTLKFDFNSNKTLSSGSIKGGNIVKSGAGLLTLGFDMLSSEETSLSSLGVEEGSIAFDSWNDDLNLRSVNLADTTVFNFSGKDLNVNDGFTADNATVNFFADSSADHVINGMISGSGNTFDLTADGSFKSQSLTIGNLESNSNNTFVVGIDNTGATPQASQINIVEAKGASTQVVDLAYVNGSYDFNDTVTFATVGGPAAENVKFVGNDASLPSNIVRPDKTTVISAITPAYSIVSNNKLKSDVTWGFERNTEYDEISTVGDVMTDMANTVYASNVYLDTLNKRMGEARYVNGEDYGVWARVRHDSFNLDRTETMKTMAEIGLTQKTEFANGDWFVGAAFDYQATDSNYDRMNADSEQKRYGLWFTATYLADSGSYADFVFKYAHLETDNTFNDLMGFNKDLSADYDNESISLSAEFGHKFMNDAGWFIEPQIQAQYTYITDTNYSTAAGTNVSIDNIDSLIGRLGFRAGRSLNDTPLTFYLRADVMHEFLGDVDLTFRELGNNMTQSESNDDTYGSVGLGFSVMSTDNMKLFVEADTLFGGDYEDSYSISMGGKYQF